MLEIKYNVIFKMFGDNVLGQCSLVSRTLTLCALRALYNGWPCALGYLKNHCTVCTSIYV